MNQRDKLLALQTLLKVGKAPTNAELQIIMEVGLGLIGELLRDVGRIADAYVFDRPVGETAQEVGGVTVTLAALCLANAVDMRAADEVELTHSPLPGAT